MAALPTADATILLDGTGQPDVVKAMLGPSVEIFTRRAVVPDAVKVTLHVGRMCSKSAFVHHETDESKWLWGDLDDLGEAHHNAFNQLVNFQMYRDWHVARSFGGNVEAFDAAVAELLLTNSIAAQKVNDYVAELQKRRDHADANIAELYRRVLLNAAEMEPAYNAANFAGDAVAREQATLAVFGQKAVMTELYARFPIPMNVVIGHFGALRGLNNFENVGRALIVGRPRPPQRALEMTTEALHRDDAALTTVSGMMETAKGIETLADGSRHEVKRETHDNVVCNRVLAQIMSGEVKQAVARVRVFNRFAANPVRIEVHGHAPSGLTAHELIGDVERIEPEEAAVGSGLFSTRPITNISLYPGVFAEDNNARSELSYKALERQAQMAFRLSVCLYIDATQECLHELNRQPEHFGGPILRAFPTVADTPENAKNGYNAIADSVLSVFDPEIGTIVPPPPEASKPTPSVTFWKGVRVAARRTEVIASTLPPSLAEYRLTMTGVERLEQITAIEALALIEAEFERMRLADAKWEHDPDASPDDIYVARRAAALDAWGYASECLFLDIPCHLLTPALGTQTDTSGPAPLECAQSLDQDALQPLLASGCHPATPNASAAVAASPAIILSDPEDDYWADREAEDERRRQEADDIYYRDLEARERHRDLAFA